ncbi:hypothetical protein T05_9730 [Trichinella murrelli]|uniref:Uncharacterized protein n=1 Tax=Trichinella murrelli TaxID=144512 RepID=A0A0V0TJN1_9BILA|nr:hypothetical protein T05_9730 [Trichinella murrelli]
MEEEPPDYLYNLGLVQQNSTDSCHPAITLSVKMVDEGPQRDSCIMAISIKQLNSILSVTFNVTIMIFYTLFSSFNMKISMRCPVLHSAFDGTPISHSLPIKPQTPFFMASPFLFSRRCLPAFVCLHVRIYQRRNSIMRESLLNKTLYHILPPSVA